MNIAALKTFATQGLGRGLLVTKKYSPEILTGVGIVGVVTASVLGAKATLKLEPIVDRVTGDVKVLKDLEGDNRKDIARVYLGGAVDVTKLYGASVSMGLASIGCILAAHGIMRRRNVALVAAYNVLEKGFAEYRSRVVEEFGLEKDYAFANGIRTTVEKDEETGEEKEVTTVGLHDSSTYARFFDELSDEWSKDPEYNLATIKTVQNHANDMLLARGHVFLNEVYDRLGIPRSKAGSVVGWVLDESNKTGDNFIDFNLYNLNSEGSRRFVNGHEDSILLDFNVNGVIFDKI